MKWLSEILDREGSRKETVLHGFKVEEDTARLQRSIRRPAYSVVSRPSPIHCRHWGKAEFRRRLGV